MFVRVIVETADGLQHPLGHGDMIGRLWSAALVLNDPRISEAHALVSLRGGQLKLLALRGMFAVGGKPRKELVLKEGLQIAFARGLHLRVVRVDLPEWVLGLEGESLPRQPLPGSCSLVLLPNPALVPRLQDGHVAAFWSTGDSWLVRRPDQPVEALVPGWTVDVNGDVYRAVKIRLAKAGKSLTHMAGALHEPMQLEVHWDTVHIHRERSPTVTVKGHPARVLSELAAVGTALNWEDLAAVLWTEPLHRDALRRRFDVVVHRLRTKLKQAGVRPDLLRPDGSGNYALVLGPQDSIDDRS